MKKGKLTGKGMTAEVYEWGHDRVLKLYFERFSDDWIRNEAKKGYTVYEAGVPSPAVFEMVEIEGRKGLILQRIFGKSILSHIEVEPWKLYYYAQQTAGLHHRIHKYTADDLPSQKERFSYTIKCSSEILGDKVSRILDYVESLPNGISVCHGDLHFNNIIVSDDKLVAIDWNSAYKGNPLGDVARTCMIINSPAMPPGTSNIMAMLSQYTKGLIYWNYLSEYMRLNKVRFEDIDAWILPVAAAKLKDKNHREKKWLMDIINKRLEKLDM
jgi:uncharacterized protein (TIGR02172 family)